MDHFKDFWAPGSPSFLLKNLYVSNIRNIVTCIEDIQEMHRRIVFWYETTDHEWHGSRQ